MRQRKKERGEEGSPPESILCFSQVYLSGQLKIAPRALQFSKFSEGIESFFPRFTCQDSLKLFREPFNFQNFSEVIPGSVIPMIYSSVKLKIAPKPFQFSKFSGVIESFFPRFTCHDSLKLLLEHFNFQNFLRSSRGVLFP